MEQGAQRFVYNGTEYVAGIEWKLKNASSAEMSWKDWLKQLKPEKQDGYALHWDTRIATTNDRTLLGLGAMAQAVSFGLTEELRGLNVLVALSDDAGSILAAFVLAAGRPVLGRESLFDTRQALVTHCVSLLEEGEIDVLYCLEDLKPDFPDSANCVTVQAVEADTRKLSPFKKAQLANPVLVAATLGAALLFAGFQYGPSLIALAPSSPKTVPMERVVPDWTRFAAECSDALNTRWPSIPGWTVTTTGCSPPTLFGQGKAYKTFTIVAGHNETIATRIAQVIYAHWPRPVIVNGSTITIEEPLAMHWQKSKAVATPVTALDFQHRVARRFVGVLASIATTREGNRSVVRITTQAGYADAFHRFLALADADLISITQSKGKTTLLLVPATPRERPLLSHIRPGAA